MKLLKDIKNYFSKKYIGKKFEIEEGKSYVIFMPRDYLSKDECWKLLNEIKKISPKSQMVWMESKGIDKIKIIKNE